MGNNTISVFTIFKKNTKSICIFLVCLYSTLSAQAKIDSTKLEYIQAIASSKVSISNADSFYTIIRKVNAQNYEVYKALITKINETYTGKNKNEIKGICNLTYGKYVSNEDSIQLAYQYLNKAIYFFKQIKPGSYLQDSYYEKACVAVQENNRDTASYYFDLYTSLQLPTANDSITIRNYLAASIEMRRGGLYDGSLNYAQQALNLATKNNITATLSTTYSQLAEIFDFTNFDTLAYEYKLKCFDYLSATTNFYEYHANVLKIYPILLKHKEANKLQQINTYYDSIASTTLYQQSGVQHGVNRYLFLKNFHAGNYQLALEKLLINMQEKTFNANTIFCYYLKEAGDCYKALHDYSTAKIYYDSCYQIADRKNFTQVLYEMLPNYFQLADTIQNDKLSLSLKDKYIQVVEQINTSKNIAKLSIMQSMLDGQNKEQMIALLQKDNAIKKVALQQSSLTKIVLAVASVLALLIAFYFWNSRKKIKQANQLLQDQKLAIQKQSEDLLSQAIAIGRLKAQMNPHFIYNAINSVQKFALNNDTENLTNYLQQFSKLMRVTLDNSEKEFITLEEEIQYLEQYIHFEKMKSDVNFNFSIEIDKTITQDNILIPPMILQPILENSIKHAVPYTSNAQIKITCTIIALPKPHLQFSITDNGPGISNKTHSIYKPETHISKGLLITQQRITECLLKDNINVLGFELKNGAVSGVVNVVRLPLVEEF